MIEPSLHQMRQRFTSAKTIPTTHELPIIGSPAGATLRQLQQLLAGDGNPQQNLASFVTTQMDAAAQRLALESLGKNLINAAEYPATEQIHQSVIRMIAELFHAEIPADENGFIGTTTVGSSEAMMLALLAHKWNWKQQLRASRKDQPYLVIGTHTHACFTKFARYFDVNVKWIPLLPGQYAITAEQVQSVLETRIADDPQVMQECGFTAEEVSTRKVGELVMGIGCVLGSTYTGALDDIAGIDRVLTDGGWNIPMHVDAASGGLVLPFTQPEYKWDFRLPHVQSINVSNHKYGLVYAGLGTLVFRNERIAPEELLVDVHYLSGEMRNFGLNFSRASSNVVQQYYNFLHLGRSGYTAVIRECLATAQWIAQSLTAQACFEVLSDPQQMPVVALRLCPDYARFTLTALAEALKRKGWIVPVYHLPANVTDIEVLRIVVKPEFTRAAAKTFLQDLVAALAELAPTPAGVATHEGFGLRYALRNREVLS